VAHRFRKSLVKGPHRELSMNGALRPTLAGPDDHVVVKPLDKRVEVASIEVLVRYAHDLHVLLRHRPRSIPPEVLLSMQSSTF
jgi:hypothetical protein